MHAIYISPFFYVEDFHAFADDNQVIGVNANLVELIDDMELRLEMMTKWPKDSGLTVNETKMEVCLYVHIVDHSRVRIGKKNLDEQTVSNQ